MTKLPEPKASCRVLAISSQVVRGHVGLSAIVPALQALSHEVWPIPTILLSNHPGHGRVSGMRVPAEQLDAMLDALDGNGWLRDVDAVVTGYLPSADHVAVAMRAIARTRSHRPRAHVLVDPVLGDDPKGLYIDPAAAAAIRDQLLPLADIVTPNRFELAWLTEQQVTGLQNVVQAAGALRRPAVIVTSAIVGEAISTVLTTAGQVIVASVPRREHAPHGTGDLLAALVIGHLVSGRPASEALARAVRGVDTVIDASCGHDELQLAGVLTRLAAADPWPLAHQPGPAA